MGLLTAVSSEVTRCQGIGTAGSLSKFGHDQISSLRHLRLRCARMNVVTLFVYDVDVFPID